MADRDDQFIRQDAFSGEVSSGFAVGGATNGSNKCINMAVSQQGTLQRVNGTLFEGYFRLIGDEDLQPIRFFYPFVVKGSSYYLVFTDHATNLDRYEVHVLRSTARSPNAGGGTSFNSELLFDKVLLATLSIPKLTQAQMERVHISVASDTNKVFVVIPDMPKYAVSWKFDNPTFPAQDDTKFRQKCVRRAYYFDDGWGGQVSGGGVDNGKIFSAHYEDGIQVITEGFYGIDYVNAFVPKNSRSLLSLKYNGPQEPLTGNNNNTFSANYMDAITCIAVPPRSWLTPAASWGSKPPKMPWATPLMIFEKADKQQSFVNRNWIISRIWDGNSFEAVDPNILEYERTIQCADFNGEALPTPVVFGETNMFTLDFYKKAELVSSPYTQAQTFDFTADNELVFIANNLPFDLRAAPSQTERNCLRQTNSQLDREKAGSLSTDLSFYYHPLTANQAEPMVHPILTMQAIKTKITRDSDDNLIVDRKFPLHPSENNCNFPPDYYQFKILQCNITEEGKPEENVNEESQVVPNIATLWAGVVFDGGKQMGYPASNQENNYGTVVGESDDFALAGLSLTTIGRIESGAYNYSVYTGVGYQTIYPRTQVISIANGPRNAALLHNGFRVDETVRGLTEVNFSRGGTQSYFSTSTESVGSANAPFSQGFGVAREAQPHSVAPLVNGFLFLSDTSSFAIVSEQNFSAQAAQMSAVSGFGGARVQPVVVGNIVAFLGTNRNQLCVVEYNFQTNNPVFVTDVAIHNPGFLKSLQQQSLTAEAQANRMVAVQAPVPTIYILDDEDLSCVSFVNGTNQLPAFYRISRPQSRILGLGTECRLGEDYAALTEAEQGNAGLTKGSLSLRAARGTCVTLAVETKKGSAPAQGTGQWLESYVENFGTLQIADVGNENLIGGLPYKDGYLGVYTQEAFVPRASALAKIGVNGLKFYMAPVRDYSLSNINAVPAGCLVSPWRYIYICKGEPFSTPTFYPDGEKPPLIIPNDSSWELVECYEDTITGLGYFFDIYGHYGIIPSNAFYTNVFFGEPIHAMYSPFVPDITPTGPRLNNIEQTRLIAGLTRYTPNTLCTSTITGDDYVITKGGRIPLAEFQEAVLNQSIKLGDPFTALANLTESDKGGSFKIVQAQANYTQNVHQKCVPKFPLINTIHPSPVGIRSLVFAMSPRDTE